MNLLWLLGVLLVFNRKVTGGYLGDLGYLVDICFKPNEGLSGTVTDHITYKLFNKNIPEGVYISNESSIEYLKFLFIPGTELKMVCHGWRESEDSESSSSIVKGYINTKDINVISIDVKTMRRKVSDIDEDYITNLIDYMYPVCVHYSNAAKTVKVSGENVASMIDHLLEIGLTSLDKVHLIGFSLGAHIMGAAASSVSSGKIARVTGLDPAGPWYESSNDPSAHLDRTDANFVDVIHTSRGIGILKPLGHVDFYPNCAKKQPGCGDLRQCSHIRAYKLYTESIYSPKAFLSHRNGEIAYMGDGVNQTVSGIFYLATNARPPFETLDYAIDCSDITNFIENLNKKNLM